MNKKQINNSEYCGQTLSRLLKKNPLGLGCMGFSEAYQICSKTTAQSILAQACEQGIMLFDTADSYGCGSNEILIGQSLSSKALIATKFGLVRNSKGKYKSICNSPKYIRQSCEGSLKRLKRERLDIYFAHRLEPQVPIEETVGELANLQAEGKIGFIGLCEAGKKTLVRASKEADIAVLQSEYSLFSRDIETDVLACCHKLGIAIMAYAPLGRGLLSHNINTSSLEKKDIRRILPRFFKENIENNKKIFINLQSFALQKGLKASQLALSWLLHQGKNIFPIFGTCKPEHLQENIQATQVSLTSQEIKLLQNIAAKVKGERYNPMGMRYINQ